MLSPYRQLLRTPGGLRFSMAGFLGRMPISMDSLALIFIVVHFSNSYTLAGLLAAVGSIVAVVALPFWARTADRYGQGRTLRIAIPLRVIFLSIFIALVSFRAPTWSWFLGIIAAEATVISTGGLVRRRWLWALGDKSSLINTAYSFEALMDEFVFILGPVLATAFATSIAPAAALIVGLIFMILGSWSFALLKESEPPPHPRNLEEPHPAVLKIPAVQAVILPTIFLGAFFSSIGITVVAFAQSRNAAGQTGLLLAIWAAGSGVAAIFNGTIDWKMNHAKRFWLFLIALMVLSIPLIFVHTLTFLAIALFCNGLAIAPLIVSAYGVAENAVPAGQITETLAWVIAGMPLGGALASAIVGWIIDTYGAERGFWVPLLALLFAVLMALPYFRTWNRLRLET